MDVDWQTAGVVIVGVIGALWAAFQLAQAGFKNYMADLRYERERLQKLLDAANRDREEMRESFRAAQAELRIMLRKDREAFGTIVKMLEEAAE